MTVALRVGTRGSPLALRQTTMLVDRLRAARADLDVQVVIITTEGDRSQGLPPAAFAERGIFVRELESALESGVIDAAVHSLKDVPAVLPDAFTLAAIPERGDARDVLHCCDQAHRWTTLPPGARIGTSSQRRAAQLRHHRSDLAFVPMRGNVETRLAKVDRGAYDACVLAAVGLQRLGLHAAITEYLPVDLCLPEAGQGALAVEIRAGDDRTLSLVRLLDDPACRLAVEAERSAVAAIGGGCLTPTACYGVLDGDEFWLRGVVASPDGVRLLATSEIGRA